MGERIGAMLRRLRREKGLGLRGVASQVGVDRGYLSRVETSRVPLSLELIGTLSEIYDVSRLDMLLAAGVIRLNDISDEDLGRLRQAVDSGGVVFRGLRVRIGGDE